MPERRAVAGPTVMQSEPNVTPMIDVLLVLLVIFMLLVPLPRRPVGLRRPSIAPWRAAPAPRIMRVRCAEP
jgi:biopolymer transport protein ExbD